MNKHNFMVIFAIFSFLLLSREAYSQVLYPEAPDLKMTPGKLCDRPVAYRYKEKIAYCNRNVSYDTKMEIIKKYDLDLGFKIHSLPRDEFKIDHLIPLCVGGSNDAINLWPQHKSIYVITDPIEPVLCAKMYDGKIKQSEAVALIIEAKTNTDRASLILDYLSRL